ncbi:type III-B CRISPR module-associated protein Cmr5 [Thermobifida cellulosilytica]|uniref:CRISPR type III-B/RAMP module-associated protein Cmr5 n=1 Tax=Thermobifida cellulosilytica TB100 TaxID=665004 RepID=A0A147KMM9_THECS|nr:type III-B CRISPR module-associated protein Cmr5 [Thermobifida cellulosilytica]KUP98491.1 hypothetical protein AC529_01100 [Thermobifida cellulosilytica TB100]
MRRLDQDMAATAAALLPNVSPEHAKELRTRFRQLPVQLHTSGLAATYAFLAARSKADDTDRLKRAYAEVAQRIRSYLADQGLLSPELGTAPAPEVHRKVLAELGRMDTDSYARASAETALLFSWLRRLADAVYAEDRT